MEAVSASRRLALALRTARRGAGEGDLKKSIMAYSFYERLTALDATFLAIEDRNAHMHVGAVSLFDAAPLRDSAGCIDMDRIRRVIEVGLHRVPRYQQRLAYVPVFGHPVWVDDVAAELELLRQTAATAPVVAPSRIARSRRAKKPRAAGPLRGAQPAGRVS